MWNGKTLTRITATSRAKDIANHTCRSIGRLIAFGNPGPPVQGPTEVENGTLKPKPFLCS